MSASGAGLRRPGIVFCLAVLLAARFSHSAPVYDQDTTQVAELNGGTSSCYYNYKHYQEGDRIITNEPCLNCTCHNRMLMCYLRVCPFTKAIGQDCTVEKRPDQCCPVITCPQVPVQLLTSTTSSPSSGSTEVGFVDNYGCNVNNLFYADGAQLPIDYHNPCELCYCIRNRTTCVMQECTLNVAGCRPIYQPGVCCPVKYDCEYDEHAGTTIGSTPGLIMTTTIAPGIAPQCFYEGKIYEDGELIYSTKPCQHCYCFRGDIACAIQDCGTPMKTHGKNCTALPPPEGECCPTTYQCESDFDNEVTSLPEIKETEEPYGTSGEMHTTLSSQDLENKSKADESYPGADNVIPEGHVTDGGLAPEVTTVEPSRQSTTELSITMEVEITTSSQDKDVSTEITDAPEIEDRGETTEKQEEFATGGIESSTSSDKDSTTEKEEWLTSVDGMSIPESITMKEVPSDTSGLPDETTATEKEDTSYTEIPEDKDKFSTELPVTESSDKSESTNEGSTSGMNFDETSTSIPGISEEQPSSEAPEQESSVSTEQAIQQSTEGTKSPDEVTEEEIFTTEMNVTPKEIFESSTEAKETGEQGTKEEPITGTGVDKETSTPIEDAFDATTKLPDLEVTTKTVRDDITTKQPVTIPIAERMPEHKAEDKDAVPEIPITQKPGDFEIEVTSEIHGPYLPPGTASTEKEHITVTDDNLSDTTEPTKDLGPSDVTEMKMDDTTTISSMSDSTTQSEIEKTSETETIPEENMPEKEKPTESSITETSENEENVSDRMKPTTVLPVTGMTEGKTEIVDIVTPSRVDTTEIPEKTDELTTEEETIPFNEPSTPETPDTSAVTDLPPSVTKFPDNFSTKSDDTSTDSSQSTTERMKDLTEVTHVDQTMSTESVEPKEKTEEKMEKPESSTTPVDIEDKHTQTTVIISDTKPTEMPHTDSLMTDKPSKEYTPMIETSTDRKVEDHSTEYPTEENTTPAIERLSTSTELGTPDKDIEKITTEGPSSVTTNTGITETEVITEKTSEPEKTQPSEGTTETQRITEEEHLSTGPVKVTEGTTEDSFKVTETEDSSITPTISESSLPESSTAFTEIETSTTAKTDADVSVETTPAIESTTKKVQPTISSLEDRLGDTETESVTNGEKEMTTPVEISQEDKTPKPTTEGEDLSPIVPKKEESETEMSHASETPAMTQSTMEESSHTTELYHTTEMLQTERTPAVPLMPEIRPPMGIPGEGNCLVDGQSYSNNSAIPPANSCQLRCRCISSIVQCDFVQCAPPPINHENCPPMHNSNDCCPTYNCNVTPESDSHMLEHPTSTTEKDQSTYKPETTESEILKTTIKTVDDHSLVTGTPTLNTEVDVETRVTETDKFTTSKEAVSTSTAKTSESVTDESAATPSSADHTTVELTEKTTDIPEEPSKASPGSEPTPEEQPHTDSDYTTAKISTDKEKEEPSPVTSSSTELPEDLSTITESISEKTTEEKLTTLHITESKEESSTKPSEEKLSTGIEATTKYDTEKTESETEVEQSTQKLTTESTVSTEKHTETTDLNEISTSPELYTTFKQPETPEVSTSTEHITSSDEGTFTMSTTHGSSSSEETPQEETKIDVTPTPSQSLPTEDITTEHVESSSTLTPESPDIKETTETTSEYSKTPEVERTDFTAVSTPKEQTTPSPSIDIITEKVTEEMSTISNKYNPPEEQTTVTSPASETQSSEVTDKTVEESISTSETPNKITDEGITETKQKTTQPPITLIDTTVTFATTKESTQEETTVYTESKTGTPSIDEESSLPTEKSEKPLSVTTEIIIESPKTTEEPIEPSTELIQKTSEGEKEITSTESGEKITEVTTSASTEQEPTKSDHEVQTTSTPTEDKLSSTTYSDETSMKETSETSVQTETPIAETEKVTSELSSLPEEQTTAQYDTSSTSSSSEEPEKEGTTMAITESTKEQTETTESKKETPEVTTHETLTSEYTESSEIPIIVTKSSETESSNTDKQTDMTTQSTQFEDKSQEPMTTEKPWISDYTSKVPEETEEPAQTTAKLPSVETTSETPLETHTPEEVPSKPSSSSESPELSMVTTETDKEMTDTVSPVEPVVTAKTTDTESIQETTSKLPSVSTESSSELPDETTTEEDTQQHLDGQAPLSPDEHNINEGQITLEPDEHEYNHTADHSTSSPEYPDHQIPEDNPNFPMTGGTYLNPDEDYDEDDQAIYGPGTCRYGGKVYMSAQQIPRDDPCDFCFCFRGDIICLQQSCPPPIPGCHEEPISGFCCPRYECPVSMVSSVNFTTTTTTTTTTLPPHFLSHAYKGAAKRSGCIVGGQVYRVGEVIKSASGPCRQCTCGGDGNMNCDPIVCSPEPMYRQIVAAATAKRRR